MEKKFKTPEQFYNYWNIAFYAAMMLPMLVFLMAAQRYQRTTEAVVYGLPEELQMFVPIISVLLVGAGYQMANVKVKSIASVDVLGRKLWLYFMAQVLKFLLFIAGMLLVTAFYYLNGNASYMWTFIVLIFVVVLERPRLTRTENQLLLSDDEKETIRERYGNRKKRREAESPEGQG